MDRTYSWILDHEFLEESLGPQKKKKEENRFVVYFIYFIFFAPKHRPLSLSLSLSLHILNLLVVLKNQRRRRKPASKLHTHTAHRNRICPGSPVAAAAATTTNQEQTNWHDAWRPRIDSWWWWWWDDDSHSTLLWFGFFSGYFPFFLFFLEVYMTHVYQDQKH